MWCVRVCLCILGVDYRRCWIRCCLANTRSYCICCCCCCRCRCCCCYCCCYRLSMDLRTYHKYKRTFILNIHKRGVHRWWIAITHSVTICLVQPTTSRAAHRYVISVCFFFVFWNSILKSQCEHAMIRRITTQFAGNQIDLSILYENFHWNVYIFKVRGASIRKFTFPANFTIIVVDLQIYYTYSHTVHTHAHHIYLHANKFNIQCVHVASYIVNRILIEKNTHADSEVLKSNYDKQKKGKLK